MNIHGEKVLIGLSGGINSAAILPWLVESGLRPSELHLYYAHFREHSPDTAHFVTDLIRYARKHFDNVHVRITRNSVIDFFRSMKMIPHPMVSPCSRKLKIEPIAAYCFEHGIKTDLVGYVRHELKRRTAKQKPDSGMFATEKVYPIGEFTDDWCLQIVKKHIGWYPLIYDILDDDGARVFNHNNCNPCKNGNVKYMKNVEKYYPKDHLQAMRLSAELGRYWGRDSAEFYTTFGRELGQDTTCEACKF